jgi:hypothetical protein
MRLQFISGIIVPIPAREIVAVQKDKKMFSIELN